MKKIVLIIICLIIPSLSQAYVDIDNTHWAYNDILELKSKKIVSGYPDNTFLPDNFITENELITVILRVSNIDMCERLNSWPQDYIDLAKENGIRTEGKVATKGRMLELVQKVKQLNSINAKSQVYANTLKDNSLVNVRDLIGLDENVTRGEACVYLNKLVNTKVSPKQGVSRKELPQVVSEDFSQSSIGIKTVIKSVEVIGFNSYGGKYTEIIDTIKKSEHPYLKYRKSFAEGNYLLAIELETINLSKYSITTGYDNMQIDFLHENISIIDEFDLDEIDKQILDLPYEGVLVKAGENHITTAFYVIERVPESMRISRDINTLYDEHTKEYVNANEQYSIIIIVKEGE